MENSFLRIARSVSGYRDIEFAQILNIDLALYHYLELHPDHASLHMIELMLPQVNRHSLCIIRDAVNGLFLPFE